MCLLKLVSEELTPCSFFFELVDWFVARKKKRVAHTIECHCCMRAHSSTWLQPFFELVSPRMTRKVPMTVFVNSWLFHESVCIASIEAKVYQWLRLRT